jgi:hypothetical protein
MGLRFGKANDNEWRVSEGLLEVPTGTATVALAWSLAESGVSFSVGENLDAAVQDSLQV